jgi:hypothetical protein
MARDTDQTARPDAQQKTQGTPPTPLPLAERRRILHPAKAPETPAQVFTDWALI